MATISEAFAMALEHQRNGRMAAAEHIYRQILQAEPNHANALRMLGVLAHQAGRHDEALKLIAEAIQGAPDDASNAACYSNLSEILRVMGRADEAVAAGRTAIQLQPGSIAGHFNLGNALRAKGRLEEAVSAYQRTIELKPDLIDAHIHLGNSLRDRGRLEDGAACFERALQMNVGSGAAHFNLGVTRKLQGRPAEAVACFRRTAELRPDFAGAYNNLGASLQDLGRLDEAGASFRRALELSPDFAGVHSNLGAVYREQGRLAEAAACCRRAVELEPGSADAHKNLGAVLKDLGKLEEAATCFHRAIALEPRGAEAHNSLGLIYKDLGTLANAAASFRRATELEPGLAEAHNNLGNALRHERKLEEAAVCYGRALALKPDFARVHHNLGILYRDQGQLEAAMASCRRALELAPNLPGPHNTLGVALMDQGKLEEGVASYRRALEIEPASSEAAINLASALFLRGRYEEAWAWYEARLTLGPTRALSTPRWNYAPVDGRTLLLRCEQGLGDTLQFLRYAAPARERARAGRVIVECQQPLARLLAESVGEKMEVVARTGGGGAAAPAHDWHLPLLSLPLALGIFEPVTMSGPYLRAHPGLRDIWRERLGPKRGLRVGLVWKGNPAHEQDRTRSIAWERFLSLLNVPGACYYSLQVGASGSETAALAAAGVIDWTAQIGDFADTAALVDELDLIVSVDTAVAHLAGAMSRPVWTLLPFLPDWRWGMEGESTPWYPSMRLFRQSRAGDWEAVVGRVRAELENLGSRERSDSPPV